MMGSQEPAALEPPFTSTLREALDAARRQPAFALYLAALAALGWKWLSPLSGLYERALWTDLLVAAATGAWLWERGRSGNWPRIRAFHLALGLYVLAGVLSMAFAGDKETAALNVLLMLELCALAVLTSDFASDRRRLNAIVAVIVIVSLYTAALAAVGLALFFAGVHTSLVGAYGELIPSDLYARVAAGFQSPPLLASYCIFASAIVAREDATLPRRLRQGTQVALAALVVLTFSRGVIGFAAAFAIRAACAHPSSKRVRVSAVAFVVVSIGIIAALTIGRLHLDPTHPLSTSYQVSDAVSRREPFTTSLDTLSEHPLVGKGPGSLPGEIRGWPFRAHMTPLNIAATMGLPALAAIGVLMVVLWRHRRRPTPIATWSGLAGLGIDALAQDVEHFRHAWVLIGLADADRRPDRGETRSPARPGEVRGRSTRTPARP